ncbi:MAG: hypothetical protein WD875_03180 [Pirellulales bacterium]
MSQSAHITSIDVLARFKLAMQKFRDEAGDSLAGAAMVIQRYLDWIEHDCVKHWQNQVRIGWEKIAEARADLARCQALAMDGERKTCHEEQEALDLSKRRLRRAEEKLESVRHWRNKVQHETAEYQARAGQLGGWLETDHSKSIAVLERMQTALEAYVAMQAPTGEASTSGLSGDATGMARDADVTSSASASSSTSASEPSPAGVGEESAAVGEPKAASSPAAKSQIDPDADGGGK